MTPDQAKMILFAIPIVLFVIWNLRLRYLIHQLADREERHSDQLNKEDRDLQKQMWEHRKEVDKSIHDGDKHLSNYVGAIMRHLDLETTFPTCNVVEMQKRKKP